MLSTFEPVEIQLLFRSLAFLENSKIPTFSSLLLAEWQTALGGGGHGDISREALASATLGHHTERVEKPYAGPPGHKRRSPEVTWALLTKLTKIFREMDLTGPKMPCGPKECCSDPLLLWVFG